jgi:sporulation protein YlmC with PRC-barrel domain
MKQSFAACCTAAGLALCTGTAAFADDTAIGAGEMRADKIIGAAVYDRHDQDVASVKDLVLDRDGKIADVVLIYGATVGIGGKYIAVNFANLKFDHDRLTLDQTKAQLASMPAYRLEPQNGDGAAPLIIGLGAKLP